MSGTKPTSKASDRSVRPMRSLVRQRFIMRRRAIGATSLLSPYVTINTYQSASYGNFAGATTFVARVHSHWSMRSGCPCHANRQARGPRPRRPWKTEVFAGSYTGATAVHVSGRRAAPPSWRSFSEASRYVFLAFDSGGRGRKRRLYRHSHRIWYRHREVLFSSTLPLEFADKLKVQNSDGTLDAEASVVALQYTNGRTAVAARFTQEVSNWIVKP